MTRLACGETHPDTYALELLGRALSGSDIAARVVFAARYRGLVLAAVRRHLAFALMREDEDALVDRTFERFWSAAGRDEPTRFPTLAAGLQYLEMCTHSLLMDRVRAQRLAQDELWQVIAADLQSEPERLVARLSLRDGLSPRQIQQRYPEWYADVAQVYRIKQEVFARLRALQRHDPSAGIERNPNVAFTSA
jgi:hypothetical protein